MGSLGRSPAADDDGTTPAFAINRIAIIGAGPSGITTAKHLLSEGFKASQIDIYEQQAEVGGVWNYTPRKPADSSGSGLRVPQTVAPGEREVPLVGVEADGVGNDGDEVAEELEKAEEEDDEEDDYEFDSDEEASTAPGSGACSLPSFSRKDVLRESKKTTPLFPGPMYDVLNTNVPHRLMRFSDLDYDPSNLGGEKDLLFPTRQAIFAYLLTYAHEVRDLVRFSTQVLDVSPQTQTSSSEQNRHRVREKWTVRSMNLVTEMERTATYDAVVVANGHYAAGHIPAIGAATEAGADTLQAFHAAHPGIISHSKSYRSAAEFAGKKVLLVGSGFSGIDLARQIREVCKTPLVMSSSGTKGPMSEDTATHFGPKVRVVGAVERFLTEERGVEVRRPTVEAEVGSDSMPPVERITNLDAIIFCTGYLYNFPFFSPTFPHASENEAVDARRYPSLTTGRRVNGLARHFLHAQHPTLAFIGLLTAVSPFPVSEAQAAVVSRLWSNRLPLPSQEKLGEWIREDEDGRGLEGPLPGGARREGKWANHDIPPGQDGTYMHALRDWALSADENKRGEAKKGKLPPLWDAEMLWERVIFKQAKNRFEETGRWARTLDELGFRFEDASA